MFLHNTIGKWQCSVIPTMKIYCMERHNKDEIYLIMNCKDIEAFYNLNLMYTKLEEGEEMY